MTTVVLDEDGRHNEKEFSQVEIMSNGWVKAIGEYSVHQYPPHRVIEVQGNVVYYEQ